MKIQCSLCQMAEAKVLCCAEEAAFCLSCDQKIHSVNKPASASAGAGGNHARLSLSNSTSPTPKCDICQETTCYFFCLEHRALLCRKCDLTAHAANDYVSRHQRFLLTGVTVPLQATQYQPPPFSSFQHFITAPATATATKEPAPVLFSPAGDMGQQPPPPPQQPFVGFSQWASESYFGSTNYVNQE